MMTKMTKGSDSPVTVPQDAFAWRRLPAVSLAADASLAADWDRLNASRRDLPFLSSEAVAAALDAFGDGGEQLLVGSAGGTVAAMFVLVRQGQLRWRTFQPAQLPLGAWVAEPGSSLDALTESLVRGPLGLCVALSVTQIDPLMAPRAADTAEHEHTDYIETAWIDVAGSFDAYWNTRSKNLRQNLRKQRNKLAATDVRTSMRMLRDKDDMAGALERYGALESLGWKADGGTAIRADNAQGRFYRRLLESAASRGEAVVCEYLFDDRVVASNLNLVRHGHWAVLKTTYDESVKPYSPASLLREDELQLWFGDGSTRRIEYFGRLMEWHSKLTDDKRTLYHLTTYRWPVVRTIVGLRRAALARQRGRAADDAAAPAAPGDGSPADGAQPGTQTARAERAERAGEPASPDFAAR